MDGNALQSASGDHKPASAAWRVRMLRWGIGIVLLIGVLALFAPSLVQFSAVRQFAFSQVMPAGYSVRVEQLACGWLQAISVRGFELIDPEANPIATIESIDSDRTLLQLLTQPSDLGTWKVKTPTLMARLRHDGSNLEDLLAALATDGEEATDNEQPTALPALKCQLVVEQAILLCSDATDGSTWKADGVGLSAEIATAAEQTSRIQLQGNLDGRPFLLESTFDLADLMQASTERPGHLLLQARQLPIAPLRYVLLRAGVDDATVAGQFSSDIKIDWQGAMESVVKVQLDTVEVASPSLLGPIPMRLQTTKLGGRAQFDGDQLDIDLDTLQSDFLRCDAHGSLWLSDLVNGDMVAGFMKSFRRRPVSTRGEIDLAGLGNTLPGLLNIRQDTRIEAGRIGWQIDTQSQADRIRCAGHLQTAEIQIVQAGQPIDWQFPLQIAFTLSQPSSDLTNWQTLDLESFQLASDAVQVEAIGNLQSGKAMANVDFAQLIAQLRQVIDLEAISLDGTMLAQTQWQTDAQGQLQTQLSADLKSVQFTRENDLIVDEPELALRGQLAALFSEEAQAGVATSQPISAVTAASLSIESPREAMTVQLTQAVPSPTVASTWPVVCEMQGELQAWNSRIRLAAGDLGLSLDGKANLRATAMVGAKEAIVDDLQWQVDSLDVRYDEMVLRDPAAHGQLKARLDLQTGAIEIPQMTLVSSTLSAAGRGLQIQTAPALAMGGDLAFRANVDRITRFLLETEDEPSSLRFNGEAVGQLRLAMRDQQTQFQLNGDIERLDVAMIDPLPAGQTQFVRVAATEPTRLWNDPKLAFAGQGTYDGKLDVLQLDSFSLSGQGLQSDSAGQITKLLGDPTVDLQGTMQYDLQGMRNQLTQLLGGEIVLSGSHTEPFRLQGPAFPSEDELAAAASVNPPAEPLVSKALVGDFRLVCETAQVYGVPLGKIEAPARLADEKLIVGPIQIPMGEGQIHASPTIYVNTPQMWMTLPPGPVAQQMRITPEMCSTWFRYIAPLLGNSTAAEGTFSLNLSQCEVPLYEPDKARLRGELIIHGGQLSAGPLAQQVLGVAQQVKQLAGKGDSQILDATKAWMQLPQQQIRFQVADGAVYHEGLRLNLDGIEVTTRGSVAVDESLSMVAALTLPQDWFADKPTLQGIASQPIELPVRGTVTQPRIDSNVLKQISTQMLGGAASGFLKKQFGSQLQKLLD